MRTNPTMKRSIIAVIALLCAFVAHAAIEVVSPETWTLYRGTAIVQPRVAYVSKAACQAAAPLDVQHRCVGTETFIRRADQPPPPPPTPPAENRTVQCVLPTVGSWTQTRTATVGPAPDYTITWSAWTPSTAPDGACTTPPPPPPPPTGVALYFSPAGNNANPGTQALPKRDLAGINVNALPAGASLLFQRGATWAMTATVTIENPNTSAAAPLTFADYGSGALPVLRWESGTGFRLGGNFSNTTNDGGYVFRNLRIQGGATSDQGFQFVQNVRDVTIDGVHIDG
jgi:hypothetical protein